MPYQKGSLLILQQENYYQRQQKKWRTAVDCLAELYYSETEVNTVGHIFHLRSVVVVLFRSGLFHIFFVDLTSILLKYSCMRLPLDVSR